MTAQRLAWDLPGLIVPPLTCFDEGGRADYASLARGIDYVIEVCRPAAIAAAAVETQEYQYLPDADRDELIRQTVRMVGGRAPVVVGVSHPSIHAAIRVAGLAAEAGACAVQVLIPNRPTGGRAPAAEIVRYFEAIAREARLPIVAYHNPGPGAEVDLKTMVELTQMDAVVALKESSRNMRYLGLVIADVQRAGRASVFATMEVLLPSLMLGADGGTMPPPGASLAALLVAAFRRGDLEKAWRIQRLFHEMPARWIEYSLAAVMKASMRLIGLDCGHPYPPYGEMRAADLHLLEAFWTGLDPDVAEAVRWSPAAPAASRQSSARARGSRS